MYLQHFLKYKVFIFLIKKNLCLQKLVKCYPKTVFLLQMEITEESCLDLFPPETLVYLTPDADEGFTQFEFLK